MVMATVGFGSINGEGFDGTEFGGGGLRADGQTFGYGCGTAFSDPLVPDTLGNMNFLPACVAHDQCYTAATSTRSDCDAGLGAGVQQACTDAGYSALVCVIIGVTYQSGVILFGAGAYNPKTEVPEYAVPVNDIYLY